MIVVPQSFSSHFSQEITMDPQVYFHPIPSFELQIFQESRMQGPNSHFHIKRSNFDFWIRIKSLKSYFIKTRWNMKFVSSKSSKAKFTMEKPNF